MDKTNPILESIQKLQLELTVNHHILQFLLGLSDSLKHLEAAFSKPHGSLRPPSIGLIGRNVSHHFDLVALRLGRPVIEHLNLLADPLAIIFYLLYSPVLAERACGEIIYFKLQVRLL